MNKIFRRVICPAMLSLFFLGIVVQAVGAESTWDSIHQRKSLKIGVVQAPPWFLKDPATGKWSGFGYSVGAAMAETLDVKLEAVEVTWGSAIAALQAPSDRKVVIHDGHELVGVRKDDPLRTGLFGALSVGFVAASVLSVLGFLLYAITTIRSRALQFGVLRATGLSVGQLVGLLSTEQLALIGIGIALGTALGAGAGWMFTRFLQVSIIARESVPPFLIVTPWGTVFQLYIILVVVFLVALVASVHLLRRMRVHAVLRLGEQ